MRNTLSFRILLIAFVITCLCTNAISQNKNNADDVGLMLDDYNVDWNIPGPTSSQSMPLGNSDIGLNIWTEPDGDVCFYISKTDAWGAALDTEKNIWIKDGGVVMKLAKIRISVNPNSFTQTDSFHQILKLRTGEILINESNSVQIKIWVDANHPVIRIETKSTQPASLKVVLDDWRLNNGDTLLSNQKNKLVWYHKNQPYADAHLSGFIFGAAIEGDGLETKNDTTLQTSNTANNQLISIYPLTTNGITVKEWQAHLDKQVASINALNLKKTWAAHEDWWNNFWHRSWIFIHADDSAKKINQGYILQRFVTACAGRGAYPIKFNGSVFIVDNPDYQPDKNVPPKYIDADYREWGGQYWMQNTRAMYWPRLMAGDFDMMLPLFNMYKNMLPYNSSLVKKYYNHDGAYFAETSPFWGGLLYMGPEVKENYTAHYFTSILELSMMMLDYYDYTGNKQFAQQTLLPIASAGIEFFDKHFGRDSSGKLLLDPDNSIEMYWKVHNPAPDIAGLHAVLKRLMALPDDIASIQLHTQWQRLYNELPALPIGNKDGKNVLLPYTGAQTAPSHNFENPELYAIYPFRLYGLGKPDLQLAINSFEVRKNTEKGCWIQDPIQAAMLGLTDIAKEYISFNLTRKQPDLKFPAFWATGHDYTPDEDNGGNGENALQQMLMQVDGKKIMLLPAWPKDWDVDFKLNAPYNTTVQGKVKNGKLTNVIVMPAFRKADVIDMYSNTKN